MTAHRDLPITLASTRQRLSGAPVSAPSIAPATSLRFPLMAAVKHAENGDHNAMLTAWADALYVAWEGRHEQLYDHEIVGLIRGVTGAEWMPPEGGAAS